METATDRPAGCLPRLWHPASPYPHPPRCRWMASTPIRQERIGTAADRPDACPPEMEGTLMRRERVKTAEGCHPGMEGTLTFREKVKTREARSEGCLPRLWHPASPYLHPPWCRWMASTPIRRERIGTAAGQPEGCPPGIEGTLTFREKVKTREARSEGCLPRLWHPASPYLHPPWCRWMASTKKPAEAGFLAVVAGSNNYSPTTSSLMVVTTSG